MPVIVLFCVLFYQSVLMSFFTTSLLVGIAVFLCDTVLIDFFEKSLLKIAFYILFAVIIIECNKGVISCANCSRERLDLICLPTHDARRRRRWLYPDAGDAHDAAS